jgi:rod shape determining protein RodA
MKQKLKNLLQKFDWVLFAAALLLSCFGLVELYSIALSQETISLLNFLKQVFFVGFGMLLLFVFSGVDYRFWEANWRYLYIAGIIFLTMVLVLGQTIRGTKGWFEFGFFNIQPVELIKILLIICLAAYFSKNSSKIKTIKQFIVSGAITFFLVFLVLLQPDFGSSLLLISIWIMSLFIAGFNKKYFFLLISGLIMVFIASWLFFFADYQKDRILTFLNINSSRSDQGYNVHQAMIAIGSGGWKGRGLGFGSQSQLKFLPEAQTDFIFSVIAEELGFFGILLLISLFGVFFFRVLSKISIIKKDFAIFYCLMSMGLIFIEMFINIGMNLGIVPVVGISLPFLSYGGSSVIANFILLGILENIIKKSKDSY